MKNTKLTTKLASRRTFLKRTAAAVGVVALSRFTARSYGQIAGANEAIRLAVVGCNDCGRAHINQFGKLSGVRIVALCDVDTAVLDRGMTLVAGAPPGLVVCERFGATRREPDPTSLTGDAALGNERAGSSRLATRGSSTMANLSFRAMTIQVVHLSRTANRTEPRVAIFYDKLMSMSRTLLTRRSEARGRLSSCHSSSAERSTSNVC